jgi:hypothetical protein
MRRSLVALATVAVFGLGWSAGQVYSQDMGGGETKAGEGAPAGGPSPEEMEAWTKAATPGDPHKKLAALDGEWVCSGRMWMDPKGPPSESTGTAKNRMIYEGRYQVQEVTGAFLGMPFEGMGILGYDNVKQEYVGAWLCNMTTGIMTSVGKEGADGSITFTGECVNPMGQKESFREVLTFKDKDTIQSVMYMKTPKFPEEFKSMEWTYTRKK